MFEEKNKKSPDWIRRCEPNKTYQRRYNNGRDSLEDYNGFLMHGIDQDGLVFVCRYLVARFGNFVVAATGEIELT